MATIKSYTDIEQSRKLAEILPIESADNVIVSFGSREGTTTVVMPKETLDVIRTPFSDIREVIPCWSLAALLKCLSKIKQQVYTPILFPSEGKWILQFAEYGHGNVCEVSYGNPVDAVFEMIEKLHELKML